MNLSTTLSITNRKEFSQILVRFDIDGDGTISPSELQLLMRSVGEELSLEDAEALVVSADSDCDGLLDLDDFIRLASIDEGGEEEEVDEEELIREAFKMYEMEGEGCITTKSLKRMLSRLGTSRDIEECRTMICRFDINGDGVLSFEEFRLMMR